MISRAVKAPVDSSMMHTDSMGMNQNSMAMNQSQQQIQV